MSPMLDTRPKRIDRYEVLAQLGQGAMGVVYRARDPQLERVVAIKTLRRDLGLPPEQFTELKTRFYQEATAAGRLNHPNLVAIYDVVEVEGVPHIVMEYLEGRTLAEIITREGPLPPRRAVDLITQICSALEYAHAHGVVHRDIKPGNILVNASGGAKLSDFGIARISGSHLTQTGVLVGTPAYMSPEQLNGAMVDGRSDLFSLGVALYEALTGVNPFKADELAATLYRVVHADPVPLQAKNPTVPPDLDTAVTRALAKTPDERYPDAGAFAAALTQALGERKASWAPTALGAAVSRRLRGPRAAVIGAGCLLVLGVATWAVWDGASGRDPGARSRPPASTTDARPRADAPGPRSSAAGQPSDPARSVPLATAPQARPEKRPEAPGDEGTSARAPVPSGASGCLSVNALPFAAVYVDGRYAGDTPRACLRIAVGQRRVYFEAGGERSPERVVRVTDQHTPAEPLRLSYDFKARAFLQP